MRSQAYVARRWIFSEGPITRGGHDVQAFTGAITHDFRPAGCAGNLIVDSLRKANVVEVTRDGLLVCRPLTH